MFPKKESSEMDVIYQNAVQSQQTMDPNSVYTEYMREEKIKNIIAQINPDSLLEDIEHRIRGEKKNTMTAQWEPISKDKKQAISEELIENYISFLGSILNQNTSLSNFSSEEINNIMSMIIEYIRDDLSDNDFKYNLARYNKFGELEVDYNEMNRIGIIICNTTFAVLKRAMNGMEASKIFKSLNMSESLSQQPAQKKGIMDFLKFG